jgi:hypothetical protein
MTIPEIRERLHALAKELNCDELATLAEATRRRQPLRRAAPRYPRLTEDQQAEVRKTFEANPALGLNDMAHMFGTNIGRISTAIRGFRV